MNSPKMKKRNMLKSSEEMIPDSKPYPDEYFPPLGGMKSTLRKNRESMKSVAKTTNRRFKLPPMVQRSPSVEPKTSEESFHGSTERRSHRKSPKVSIDDPVTDKYDRRRRRKKSTDSIDQLKNHIEPEQIMFDPANEIQT